MPTSLAAMTQPDAAAPARQISLTRFLIQEQHAGHINADLRLLAGGYSNKEIARAVFLSEGSVKNYVSDILVKLEARDRTRAVLKAITLRVI